VLSPVQVVNYPYLFNLYYLIPTIFHLFLYFFLFTLAPSAAIYSLSLHDALPISARRENHPGARCEAPCAISSNDRGDSGRSWIRSEEHTSELQSRFDLACRLRLEKKIIPSPTHA